MDMLSKFVSTYDTKWMTTTIPSRSQLFLLFLSPSPLSLLCALLAADHYLLRFADVFEAFDEFGHVIVILGGVSSSSAPASLSAQRSLECTFSGRSWGMIPEGDPGSACFQQFPGCSMCSSDGFDTRGLTKWIIELSSLNILTSSIADLVHSKTLENTLKLRHL